MDNRKNDEKTSEAYSKVVEHFKGDTKKVNDWFFENNKEMGNKSPLNLIAEKRGDILNEYIDRKFRGKK